MEKPSIEVGDGTIKQTYLRFISDSSSGFVLLLSIVLVAKWIGIGPPVLGTELKVFMLAVVVLLAAPIGLAMNAISHFLLGTLRVEAENLWWRHELPRVAGWLVKPSRDQMQFDGLWKFYRLDINHWHRVANMVEHTLSVWRPDLLSEFDHAAGIGRFFRNLSLLSFLVSLQAAYYKLTTLPSSLDLPAWEFVLLCFAASPLLLVLSSLAAFYYDLGVMLRGYLICFSSKWVNDEAARLLRRVYGVPELSGLATTSDSNH